MECLRLRVKDVRIGAASRVRRIGFGAGPAGDVRKRKMRGNTLQCTPEIAAASYWKSTECVATDPLQIRGDYDAVHARFAEMIRTSNYS
jgi:hypothetical protein